MALIGMRVDSLPKGNRLGDFDGWFGEYYSTEFSVECSKAGVEVQAGYQDTYALDILYFSLRPKGVFARVEFGSCIDSDFDVRDVGGCAWIMTDGIRAVLEFELYAIRGHGYLQRYVGRVQLGTTGVKMAQHLSSLAPGDNTAAQEYRTCDYEGRIGTRLVLSDARFNSSGYVDALGRRQGLWTIYHDAEKLVEVEWTDGVVDGRVQGYRPGGTLMSLDIYASGLEHGEHTIWTDSGRIQGTTTWANGMQTGERTAYHSNGRKWSQAIVVGSNRVVKDWDEEGNLVSEKSESMSAENSTWRKWHHTDRTHLEEIEAMRLSRKF